MAWLERMCGARDKLSGLLFFIIGGGFCIGAATGLKIGTASQMGPGFFPMLVGGLLALFGLVILVKPDGSTEGGKTSIAWRGLVMIATATLSFGLFVRDLGFAPTMMLTVSLACFASPDTKVSTALITAASLTLFCSVAFIYGLGLPFRLFGPWLQF